MVSRAHSRATHQPRPEAKSLPESARVVQSLGGELLFDAPWLRQFDSRLDNVVKQFHEVRYGRSDAAPAEAREELESMGWSMWRERAESRRRNA